MKTQLTEMIRIIYTFQSSCTFQYNHFVTTYLTNKNETFIIRIYHDARSSECQNLISVMILNLETYYSSDSLYVNPFREMMVQYLEIGCDHIPSTSFPFQHSLLSCYEVLYTPCNSKTITK
jgi:hypothetical protein